MVGLRICVLVCASTEQFPDKSVSIKTVSVTSSNLQPIFLIVLRRVCLLSLYMGQIAYCKLKTGFNVFWKLCLNLCSRKWLKANAQSCNEFDSSMIFTIKNIIWGWPDKFQDIVFKNTKDSDFSNVMIKTFLLYNSWWKKRIFEKNMFWFGKGNVFSISSVVRGIP